MPRSEKVTDPIRVTIVDDHPIVREGLVSVLGRDAGIVVVGEGGTAKDALDLADEHLPHVMLLDVNMPGDGLAALERISAKYPAIAVIMLTVKEDTATVSTALKLGARGYVLKGIGGAEIAKIIRAIHNGDPYITPTLAARLLIEASTTATPPPRSVDGDGTRLYHELTVREGQILALLADGLSNKQIAAELALSENTVKHYMTNLMQKLQVRNRVEAALLAKKKRTKD